MKNITDRITECIPEAVIELVDSEIMNQLSYHVLANRFEKLGFSFEDTIHSGIEETINLIKH